MGSAYASLEELKELRRITDASSDRMLQRALAAATTQIEQKTGRAFGLDETPTTRTYGVTGRITTDGRLLVDDIGALDGLAVETSQAAGNWAATTQWEAGPLNAVQMGRPVTELASTVGDGLWRVRQVRVTARWGWPSVPDDISLATLLLASRLYQRRDSPEGVLASAEWGATRLSRWDPDVESLVSPYVLPGVA